MGFEEISHTADWSIRVWAQDLAGLLAESARGMNWLSGAELVLSATEGQAEAPRERRVFEANGQDEESLLIAFLSELVYYAEQENMGFDHFEIAIKNGNLKVEMEGAPLKSLGKAIKAVTWHKLEIQETARGLEVEIVFDV